MEIILVYNTSELYSCLEIELQKIGIRKPHIIQLYTKTWLKAKLWEIHNVPLYDTHSDIPMNIAYKTLRVLPEYLDRMLFYATRMKLSAPSDLARVEFNFNLGQLTIRYL